jgi:hypothetical protein
MNLLRSAGCAALALLAGASASAQVTLPFYDGFPYAAPTNLAGQGSWVAAAGSGTIRVAEGNLTFPGLTNGPANKVTLIPSGTAARTYLPFTPQATNSFCLSFLFKVNNRPSAQSLLAYVSGSTASDTTPSLGIFLRSTGELAVGVNTSSPQYVGPVLNLGETYLVVVRYTFGSPRVAEVWINPASLGGDAPPPSGTAANTESVNLAYFLWNTPSSGGGSFEVDEFRIGPTYASVTPPSGGLPPGPVSAPIITETRITGSAIILRGSNGPPGAGFEVLTAPGLAATWIAIHSNTFTGSGTFDCTNPVNPALDQGFFRLRVTGGGTNPPAATPPVITSQPQNQNAALGQGALFSVTATGTAPLSYQWFFNTNTPVPTGTNQTLVISSVTSNDAGAYHVVVANAAGSATSAVATLTLAEAPTNGNWFVSPTGSDANPGTLALPFATVGKAASVAQPGHMIYVRGGTYYPTATIRITNSGAPGNRISLLAYPGERPYLNFTNQPYGAANRGILFTTNGNHWNVKGLEIGYAGDNGVKVEGSYIRFEECVFHHCGDTGLQIGFGHYDANPGGLLAAFIEVINCDSYLNFDKDSNGGDADGFAAKMHCGQGIVFIGCRAWENSDDGWDLFETDYSVVISNCWTWKSGVGQGNGNGFKLGGDGAGGQSKGTHSVYHSVAFGHKVNGFTQNSHRDGLVIEHCLSFSNGTSGYNYFMEGTLNSGKTNIFRNNVSIPRSGVNTGGFIADNNPIQQNNSWNLAVTANAADYVSLAEAAAKAPRLPDGSLPTGFARLVAGSDLIDQGVNVGRPFNGAAPDLGPYEYTP